MTKPTRSDQDNSDVSRRSFLQGGALAGAAALGASLGGCHSGAPIRSADDLGPIPRRVLGKTGVEVSILGLGTACMGEGPQSVDECAEVFSEAIDRGITYVDTARIYRDAEPALGNVLKAPLARGGGTRRDAVFLATKCMVDTYDDARKSFEQSLRQLRVDHVDLLHLHSTGDRDLDTVLGPRGAWKFLREMKEQGLTRFIGITGHNRPANFVRMVETGTVDVMMVAMNFVDRHVYGFEDKVLPIARDRQTAAMAMKVFGGIRGGFKYNRVRRPSQMDPIFHQIAVRYALSLEGVTGLVIGVHDAQELRQNIRFMLNAPTLSKSEMKALRENGKRLAESWSARLGPVL